MAKSVLKVSSMRKDSEAYTELYNKDGMEVYATKSGKFEIHCGATHTWASNLVDVADKINHLDLHTFPGSGNDVVAAIKAKLGQQYRLEIKASKDSKEKVLHTVEGSLDKIADNMMGISPVDIRTMTAGQRYAMGPNMYSGDYMILIPMSMGIDDSSFAVPQMYEKQVFGKGMVLNGLDPATGELVSIIVSEAYPNGAFKDGDGKVWSDEDKDLYQFAIGTPATDVETVDFNKPTDSIYESEDIPSYNPIGVVKEQAPMVGNLKNYDNMLTAGANVIHDFMKTCKKAAFIDRSSLNKITVTAINSDGQATDGEMSWNVRVTSPNYKRSSCITVPLIMKEGSIDLGKEFITSTGQKYPLTAASLKEHLGALAEDDFWRRASRKDMSDRYPSTLHADKDVDALLAGIEIKEEKRYMNPETGSVDTYDGWFYKNEDGKEVNAVDLGEVVEVDKNGNAVEASKKTAEGLRQRQVLMMAASFVNNMSMYKEEIDKGELSVKDRAAELLTEGSWEGFPKFSEQNQKQIVDLVRSGMAFKGFTEKQIEEAIAVLLPAFVQHQASKKTAGTTDITPITRDLSKRVEEEGLSFSDDVQTLIDNLFRLEDWGADVTEEDQKNQDLIEMAAEVAIASHGPIEKMLAIFEEGLAERGITSKSIQSIGSKKTADLKEEFPIGSKVKPIRGKKHPESSWTNSFGYGKIYEVKDYDVLNGKDILVLKTGDEDYEYELVYPDEVIKMGESEATASKKTAAEFPISLEDDILKGFSGEELVDTVISNEHVRDEKGVQKVYKGLVEIALEDSKERLNEALPEIKKELKQYEQTAAKKTAAGVLVTYYFNVIVDVDVSSAEENNISVEKQIDVIIDAAMQIEDNVLAWLNKNIGRIESTGHTDDMLGGNITVEKNTTAHKFIMSALEDNQEEPRSTSKGDLPFDPYEKVDKTLASIFNVSLSFSRRTNLPEGTDDYSNEPGGNDSVVKESTKKTAAPKKKKYPESHGESYSDVMMQQKAIESSETPEEAVQKLKDMGYVSTFRETGDKRNETIEELVDRVWSLYKDPAWKEDLGSKKTAAKGDTFKTKPQKDDYQKKYKNAYQEYVDNFDRNVGKPMSFEEWKDQQDPNIFASKKTAETLIMKEELQDVRENPEDYGLLPGQVDTMTDEEIEVFLEEKMHVVSATEMIPKSKQTPIGADADQRNNVSAAKKTAEEAPAYTLGVIFMDDSGYMDNEDVFKKAVEKFGKAINVEVEEDGAIVGGVQVDSVDNALAVARVVDALGGMVDGINKGNFGLIAENHGGYDSNEAFVKDAFGTDKEASKKTNIKKRAVAKTHKVDTTEIGDGGTPNKYWVSTSKDFMANTMEESGELNWASDIKALNWKVSNEGSEFGPYNTFKEAKAKYDELYSELGSEPREDGFNTISIEDRVSGQVYEGGVIGYASRFGYKFEIEEHDDTSYTSKHLGYDITTEEPGEETTETKETV